MKRLLTFLPFLALVGLLLFGFPRVHAQSATQHGVEVTWVASTTAGVTGYNVYRSTDGVNFTKLTASPITVTNYLDQTAAVSTSYEYDSTAVIVTGGVTDESSASNIASITTPAAFPTNPAAPTGCSAKTQ
jgi:hypothetical protein